MFKLNLGQTETKEDEDALRIKRKAEAALLKQRLKGRVFKAMPPSARKVSSGSHKMRAIDGTVYGPFRSRKTAN